MESYTGICKHCGQTQIVKAESQEDANERTTLECSCPGGELERTKKHVREQLDVLIGELAPDNGWDSVRPEVFETIKAMADRIAENLISSCAMRVDGTNLKISRSKDKINIERSKTVRQGGVH